jgi:positive regulator of sigma E activity
MRSWKVATLWDLEIDSQVSPSLIAYFLPLQVLAVGVAVTDEVGVPEDDLLDLRSISIQ